MTLQLLARRPTHSGRLERWFGGTQDLDAISLAMRDWYGAPIALRGAPGLVYAAKGGDFVGPIEGGAIGNLRDYYASRFRRFRRDLVYAQEHTASAGFATLQALIDAATRTGRQQHITYSKAGVATAVAGSPTIDLWTSASVPVAGSNAAAAPGGTVLSSASTGSMPFRDAASGETLHLTGWTGTSTIGGNAQLLYDRLFAVRKTMSSTGTEAVSGVPTRYQGSTGTSSSPESNFVFPVATSALSGTAHNWTVCLYTDESGNTGQTMPSIAGVASNPATRLDLSDSIWFMRLADGDTGIKALEQMQCSASVTGGVDFVMGHPLAIMPSVVGNLPLVAQMINDAFNLQRIFDGACLALLAITTPNQSAANYRGHLRLVSS